MSRPLVPLARPLVVSGQELRFPVQLRFRSFDAVALAAPRPAVAPLLAGRYRPVPAGWRGGSLFLAAAEWETSPVGPFHEVMLLAPSYRGRGSPIPGLATFLHGRLGRTDAVGEYGYTPLWSLVDREEAAFLRRDLWHVPVRFADIDLQDHEDGRVIRVTERGVDVATIHGATASSRSRATGVLMPIHGWHDGVEWSDHLDLHANDVTQRWRGAGSASVYARGPLAEFAVMFGATDRTPFETSAFAALRAVDGVLRSAGPRPADR